MIRALFIFKLMHINTVYIILNNINGAIGFSSLINNYSKY